MDNDGPWIRFLRFLRLINSGALGLATVAVVQLSAVDRGFDLALTASLYCLAVSIPLTATNLFFLTFETDLEYDTPRWMSVWARSLLIAGPLYLFFLGVAFLFLHFGIAAVALFVAGSCYGYTFIFAFITRAHRQRYPLRLILQAGVGILLFTAFLLAVPYLLQHFIEAYRAAVAFVW